MNCDHFEYRIAEHYLSALINSDTSGLEDDEERQFNEWEAQARADARSAGLTVGHWVVAEGSGEDWGRCDVSGLFAMRCTVRLMCYRKEVAA